MSHRDSWFQGRRLNAGLLKVALLWLFRDIRWSSVRWRADCTWTPRLLAAAAVLWAWSDESNLATRFIAARRITLFLFRPQGYLAASYQGFIKLLVRWTPELAALIRPALRARMRADLAGVWQVGGRLLFGIDGSKIELPRTRSNQTAYAAAWRVKKKKRPNKLRRRRRRRGAAGIKKADTPLLGLTTVWHVGSGLPWSWRIGGGYVGERAHVREMLPEVPAGAILAGDAGMVGFDLIRTAQSEGLHMLVRVGRNVRLLTRLGQVREHDGIVYLWPQKEQARSVPPLVLRLVVCHNGRHPVHLVTTLLDAADCPDDEVVRMYKRRWGIEVYHRGLKQTFQRRKLRSHSAAPVEVELQWSLVGLWALSLYALVQVRAGGPQPGRPSCAKVLEAFRRMLRDYLHPAERNATLCRRLRRAVIDEYARKAKASRDYPRKKITSPPGPPTIVSASAKQIRLAKGIQCKMSIELTA
jgi:IS4 transposase